MVRHFKSVHKTPRQKQKEYQTAAYINPEKLKKLLRKKPKNSAEQGFYEI